MKSTIISIVVGVFLISFTVLAEENASREIIGVIGLVKSEFKTDVDLCLKELQKVFSGKNIIKMECRVRLLENNDDLGFVVTRRESMAKEPKQRKAVPFLTDGGQYARIEFVIDFEGKGYNVFTTTASDNDNISEENFVDALKLLFRRYPKVSIEHTLILPYRN
mgnify:CR=1 FL=1